MRTLPIAILFAATGASLAADKTYLVSATSPTATHASIQAAVNDCQSGDSCVVLLVDPSYTLERPIWIEGKSKIAIVGKTKGGVRPILTYAPDLQTMVANPLSWSTVEAKVRKVFTLPFLLDSIGRPCDPGTATCSPDPKRPAGWQMWPHLAASASPTPIDRVGDKDDTSNEFSPVGHMHNGMIVVKHSTDITLQGLALNGGRPMYFVNEDAMDGHYDLQFGTVGVNLLKSLRASILDCEINFFYAGIFVNGGKTPNSRDANRYKIDSTSGGHLIEQSRIHDNWWAFYHQSDMGPGSIIRYNLAWNNLNKALQYPNLYQDVSDARPNIVARTGGFLFQDDSIMASYRIHNNTIYKYGVVFGYTGWGPREIPHVFYNNLLLGFVDSLGSGVGWIDFNSEFSHMLSGSGLTVFNNTFELEGGVEFGYESVPHAQIVSDTLPNPNEPGAYCYPKGCWVNIDPVRYVTQIRPPFLWNGWGVAQGGYFDAYYTDKNGKRWGAFQVYNRMLIDSVGLITTLAGRPADSLRWKKHRNMYAFLVPLLARDSLSDFFLVPQWGARTVDSVVRGNGWADGNRNLDGSLVDRGAYCLDAPTGKSLLGGCSGQTSGLELGPRNPLQRRSVGFRTGLDGRDPLGRIRPSTGWLPAGLMPSIPVK